MTMACAQPTADIDSTVRRVVGSTRRRSASSIASVTPIFPFLRQREQAASVQDPVTVTTGLLFERVLSKVIRPALSADTSEEFAEIVTEQFGMFLETMQAVRVLAQGASPRANGGSAADYDEMLITAARRVSGEQGADEARFIAETFTRTMRLLAKCSEAESTDVEAEGKALAQLQVHCGMHFVGTLAIFEASSGFHATAPAIAMAFEYARGSALRAYGNARTLVMLRVPPPEPQPELMPFDSEDAYLAGINA